ncbi:DUF262 domain-containing protein [Clostridium cibarium]|uniref:DUF262 domain-containing protein n=1 Tax=Clostridium cibarium TaxID=2762247 RepID=A0ABR8PV78_9CLOT|nr:DUF262 domain-containing protein [Clostridium cibarium]MBD7912059.1 DUF262 domain-containing protein [Clostridium cibarium]
MRLYENEFIKFDDNTDNQKNLSDEDINKKYLLGESRIVTEQGRYPLDTIPVMIDSGKYKLNPDFQRRHRWNNQKKSRLIESFIMNVPIPPIFLYEDDYSHYEVMDGLQRLTAIDQFYKNKFKLEGLEYWEELNGRTYEELPIKIKQGIDRRYISSLILLQETAKSKSEARRMKQIVFERINNGGVKLEGQETRNALYNGPMNELCLSLSDNRYLKILIGVPIEDSYQNHIDYENDLMENELYSKMKDVEYVLRFFAMRQIDGYQGRTLNEFFDYYMKKANLYNENLLNDLKAEFERIIEFAYDLLGENAFYLWRKRNGKWNWLNKATTTVFDAIMYVLSELFEHKEKLLLINASIQEDLIKFYEKNYGYFEGRNNNKSNIEQRRELYRDFFTSYLEE